ncbi:cell adhesion molecule DSCAM-like isoform X3 [Mytilus californianus]|uniref:cell adhesion molecule DSCAM-like isoform X3 n=1 Tax=Mytilus californianus TaxID=6549 RepID=UPI002246BB14|nr:cell adhesion molecule DSCAM-like isoform X3 [Mytilus californianus]
MWISILRLLLLLLHILEVVIGASWEQRPTDVSAAVGSTVTLTCKVTGDPGFVTWNKNGNTLAVGTSIVSGDKSRITIPVASKFNLQISDVQKSDDDDYTCNIQNIQPDSQKAVTVHLTVLVIPGPPSIQINDTRPQKVENDVVSLTCSSSGGNPPPEFTWTKNGLVLNSNKVETKVPKGLSSSQLTVHLDYSDHLASYSCSVKNSVNQDNPFSTSTQISVLYHPRITFKPYKELSLELGSAGSLECNVSANPPVTSISWTKDGQPLQTTDSRIDFSPASKTDSGSYSCSCSNSINGVTKPASDTATVSVLYPPVVTIPEVYEVNGSATLDITCNVDAYPAPFYTRWQKTDNSIQSNNDRLTIDNIKRSHKGNYSCISKNAMRPSGQDERIEERIKYTYLYVRYSPGSSNIAPVSPVFVGNSLTLSCSVSDPGYPAPTYEWRKIETNQLLATETSRLVINGVTLQDNGNYSCTPKNMMGMGGISTVHVVVNEKPTYVGVHKDKDTIYNNRTGYWLQCKVRGRPEPLIQWYKNGKPLDTSGKLYRLTTTVLPIDTFSFLVTSQVYLQGSDRVGTTTPQISDVASYTCKETTSNINHTTQLFIYFPPTITPDEKEASIAGGTAQLKCIGEGYPVPNFVWKRSNAVISSGGRLTIHQIKVISVTRSESILQIDRIVGQDFGPYTCEMSNQFGKTTKTITLTVKSKPEAPTGLSSPKRSWDKVTLRWTPGFNGGSYQAFVVKYKSNPPNAGDQSIRVMPDNATEFTVSNLLPSIAYVFQVCGYNELGEGDLSDSITITTNGYTFPFIKETPEFSGDNKELILNLDVNSTFCVKVKVSTNGGQSWQTFTNNDLECFDANVAKMIITTNGVDRMNVSLCLVERMDVCGLPVSVRISSSSTPDLTETEVIIIGCVCAAILVALLTVLVCIICRRRKLAKQLPPQTSTNLAANGHAIPPQKPPRGYENTGIQGLDLVQTHGAHAGVSYINPSYSHDDYSEMNRNGYPPFPRHNGNVPIDHDSSYDPEYENEMNRLNANQVPRFGSDFEEQDKSNYFNEKQADISFTGSPRSPIKEKQYIDMSSEHRKGDLINGQESGYNTPDNPKPPKKVIYEVVV